MVEEKKNVKQAVALKYDLEKDHAPKIVASGQGIVAEKILDAAKKNEISLHEDAGLVKQLIQYQVGTEIPPELYEVVAQILVFVDMVDGQSGTRL